MKARLSVYAYIVSALVMIYMTLVFYPKWNASAGQSVFGWDVSGYYWYLPSIIIYKDLKQQKFGDSVISKYWFTGEFEQSYVHESGNRVNTYSSGMSVMYLPLFLAAHAVAEPLGYEPDGFSVPYQFALQVGSLLAALIALWYFRKLFLLFFEDKVVAILLLLLVLGTNYLNYATMDNALTHNWLFLLYVFLLLNTIYFYREPSYKYAVRIGLLCGLMILIRPSEIICVLIPLLWGMERLSIGAVKDKMRFLIANWKNLAMAAVCTIAVGSIQMAYWLYVTGKPLVYSYRDKGFSWLHPHWKDYMISYRSGWITYTPLMILCFVGIPFFLKYGKNKIAILTFFALNLYIVCAWDVWWYGGTGGRAMVQSYPVIMFPMAVFLQYISKRRVLAWVLSPFIIVLAYFNIWFTYNAHAGQTLYDANGMTKAYYWNVIYRYKVSPGVEKLKDTDELFSGEPQEMKLVFSSDFEADTLYSSTAHPAISGSRSALLAPGIEYINLPAFAFSREKAEWLRVQGSFRCVSKEFEAWAMAQLTVKFTNKGATVKDRMIRVGRFLKRGDTKALFIDVKLPQETFDSVNVFIWNPGSDKTLLVDDIKVWSFRE